MSSNVSADLESLVNFRSHLMSFNRTLGEEFSSMLSHWHALGDAWSDSQYHAFGQALAEVHQGIVRYLAVTDTHEAHLLRLIKALEEFLGQRLGD